MTTHLNVNFLMLSHIIVDLLPRPKSIPSQIFNFRKCYIFLSAQRGRLRLLHNDLFVDGARRVVQPER